MNARNNSSCSGWCTPLKIYIAIGILSIFLTYFYNYKQYPEFNSQQHRMRILLYQLVSGSAWGLLIYWLCSNCMITLPWIIVGLPLIFVALFIIVILDMIVFNWRPSLNPSH